MSSPASPIISVLIADDSPVAREFLTHVLQEDPAIKVVGTVRHGQEALEWMARRKPDVVLMDIHMPVMNGLEATRRIMSTCPVPVIIVSATWDRENVARTFQAMEAGAVAAMEKPAGLKNPATPGLVAELVRTVKLMAGMPLVRRWSIASPPARPSVPIPPPATLPPETSAIRLVAVGASTGGPPALQAFLAALPPHWPVPLLIVQHISPGFLPGMAEWLEKTTGVAVRIPRQGDPLLPAHAYLAPDGCHMGVRRDATILLSTAPEENSLRPSVSFLFRSVAREFGRRVAAVLLTGMGRDGAEELLAIRQAGGITFAQDKESSVVHGMPGEAIALGAACHVKPPAEIARLLVSLVNAHG